MARSKKSRARQQASKQASVQASVRQDVVRFLCIASEQTYAHRNGTDVAYTAIADTYDNNSVFSLYRTLVLARDVASQLNREYTAKLAHIEQGIAALKRSLTGSPVLSDAPYHSYEWNPAYSGTWVQDSSPWQVDADEKFDAMPMHTKQASYEIGPNDEDWNQDAYNFDREHSSYHCLYCESEPRYTCTYRYENGTLCDIPMCSSHTTVKNEQALCILHK